MTADTVGGVWTYALELARELGYHGVEVILATMGAKARPEQRAEVEQLGHVHLIESAYRLEWMENPWDDVDRAGDWLLTLEERFQPDVVHLNGYAHGALPWRAPVLVAAHSCVLSWWQAVKHEPAPAAWSTYATRVRAGLEAADAVVTPTAAMRTALRSHYGELPEAHVIPNGRDPSTFMAAEKKPFVLSVGRLWDEAKNVSALARVAPELPWPVLVAGECEGPDGRSTALPNLEWLGHCHPEALADLYARAGIFALPARYEPFGLSALEAGLAGCALVLGDIPSLREVWGDAALYVPPDDPDLLFGTIAGLIGDEAHRDDLGAAARRRAQTFTTARMGAAYLDAYAALLASGPAPVAETALARFA